MAVHPTERQRGLTLPPPVVLDRPPTASLSAPLRGAFPPRPSVTPPRGGFALAPLGRCASRAKRRATLRRKVAFFCEVPLLCQCNTTTIFYTNLGIINYLFILYFSEGSCACVLVFSLTIFCFIEKSLYMKTYFV